MPYIEISSIGMSNSIMETETKYQTSIGTDTSLFSNAYNAEYPDGFTSSSLYFYLMSGTFPTQAQLDSSTAPYPAASATSGTWGSQILLRLKVNDSYGDAANFQPVIIDGEHYAQTRYIKPATAEASGVATWWLIAHVENTSSGSIRATKAFHIIGDITTLGGGGSMTMQDPNVIAGKEYEIGPINIHIPRRYEWT